MPVGSTLPSSAGDSHAGGAYGAIRARSIHRPVAGEVGWPYSLETELELLSHGDDELDDSRCATKKKSLDPKIVDVGRRASYRSGSYVDGSTRGLTGIMSGVTPRKVLETFIKVSRRCDDNESSGDALSRGPGASMLTMSPDPTTRTRPGRGLGSKQGWFRPHPPKASDPIAAVRITSLSDLAALDDVGLAAYLAQIDRETANNDSNE